MYGARTLQTRPTAVLALTRVTLDEFPRLVPPFAAAFQASMRAGRLAGTPRTARRFPVYEHCPLPTHEDRRRCMLASLKTSALQVVQGRLFGLGQSIAHPWMHGLLPGGQPRSVPVALPRPIPAQHSRTGWVVRRQRW